MEAYEEMAPFADALELNISCPNIASGGAAMGATPEGAASVVKAVRGRTTRPLIVKMAPERVGEVAAALEDAGADILSLINTIPGMAIDVKTRKVGSHVQQQVFWTSNSCHSSENDMGGT